MYITARLAFLEPLPFVRRCRSRIVAKVLSMELVVPLGLGLWGVVIGVAIASILAGVLQAVLLE